MSPLSVAVAQKKKKEKLLEQTVFQGFNKQTKKTDQIVENTLLLEPAVIDLPKN